MRDLVKFAVVAVALVAGKAAHATVTTVTAFSPSNNRNVSFQVYTPPGYSSNPTQRYPAVYKGLELAAWLERLETLLEQLETLSDPKAYQFDSRHVPHLLNLKRCGG